MWRQAMSCLLAEGGSFLFATSAFGSLADSLLLAAIHPKLPVRLWVSQNRSPRSAIGWEASGPLLGAPT